MLVRQQGAQSGVAVQGKVVIRNNVVCVPPTQPMGLFLPTDTTLQADTIYHF